MRRKRSAAVSWLVLPAALASLLLAVGSAASGRTLSRCSGKGYGLELRTAPADNAVRLTVGWLTAQERRHACLLHTTIRVRITGTNETATGAAWKIESVRRPWSGIVHTWAWSNWCDGKATVELRDRNGRTSRQHISDPPACVDPNAPSTLDSLGTGTRYVKRPSGRIRPHLLPKGAPPPLPYAVLKVKNAWVVSDGYTLVAVYAGSPGEGRSLGRFAIVRQNAIFGVQYNPPDIVDVGRVGAVKITRAPRGRSHETDAQHGELAFVSKNGTRGVLELTGDRVRISS